MPTTDKTRVRNAMGKHHKTAAELARATGLSEAAVKRALHRLVSEDYTRQDPLPGGGYGYRRIRMPRAKPTQVPAER